jgi:cell division protein FtsB
MRIRRSVTRFFGALVIPAICCGAIAYYGYYLIWGTRGLLALADVRARLEVTDEHLNEIRQEDTRLARRIALLKAQDPDLIEEIARDQLVGNMPGQVVVPREKHP